MRAAALLVLVAACGGGETIPDASFEAPPPDASTALVAGDPIELTPDNPAEDEDPCVLVTSDGTLVVAYFGRVDGNADLFLRTSRDGITWNDPVRITTAPEDDLYPNLIQDRFGRFHLTWFRQIGPPTYYRQVWYASTDDLTTWGDGIEASPTAGDVEDWVPTITTTPAGLAIVFTSKLRSTDGRNHLFVITSPDGVTWSAPAPLPEAPGEHDHLAQIAETGEHLTMVWVRCDETPPLYCFAPGADVFLATSDDDPLSWRDPIDLTGDDGAVDALPGLYQLHDGRWAAAWVTESGVVDLVLGETTRGTLPLDGYSPRVAPTPTPGIFLGAYVAGPTGQQDVFARLFER